MKSASFATAYFTEKSPYVELDRLFSTFGLRSYLITSACSKQLNY